MSLKTHITPQSHQLASQSSSDRKSLIAEASLQGAFAYFISFFMAGILFTSMLNITCPTLTKVNLIVLRSVAIQITSTLLVILTMGIKISTYQSRLSKLIKSPLTHTIRMLRLHKAPRPSVFFKNVILWFPAIWLGCMGSVLISNIISNILTDHDIKTQGAIQIISQMTHPAQMVLMTISVIILAPISEEITFRGCIYRYLESIIGKRSSIILTSLLFAGIHFHIGLVLPLFFLGVCLQLLKNRTNNLYISIAVHALFNSVTIVQMWMTFLNN